MRSRSRAPAAALAIAAWWTTASVVSAQSPSVAQTQDVISHDLTLTPDFEARSVAGVQALTVRRLGRLPRLSFSANALTIEAARYAGRPVRWRTFGDRLIFDLPPGAPESGVLRVRYHGRPRRSLVFTGPSVTSAYFTCDCMICEQDRTGDRARSLSRWSCREARRRPQPGGATPTSPRLGGTRPVTPHSCSASLRDGCSASR